jgi:3-oxoacyl-[acyl-carrier protein] reductase
MLHTPNVMLDGPHAHHTATDMSAIISPEMRKVMLEQTPLEKHCGTPEEVANVAVFLATGEASWVTGQNIELAGGF